MLSQAKKTQHPGEVREGFWEDTSFKDSVKPQDKVHGMVAPDRPC